MKRIQLKPAGAAEAIECAVERQGASSDGFAVRIADGEPVHVEDIRVASGRGCLRIDGRSIPYFSARNGLSLHVWIDGQSHVFTIVDGRGGRSRGSTSAASGAVGDVIAPMPGTILQVKVAAGQSFKPGDALVVMESMKMEMTLSAHHPGKVSKVACAAGQMVEMGAVLVHCEPPE